MLLSVLSVVRAIVSLGVRARVCVISGLLLLDSIRVFRAIVCLYVIGVIVMGCCIEVLCSLILLVIHGVCGCVSII